MKTSCTIIVSHYCSLPFLRMCVRQLRKYKNKEIEQTILICDQSDAETFQQIVNEYGDNADMIIVHTKSLYSGFGIDYCMRHIDIKTEYIAQYHCDAAPISDKHLYLPIKLIEEYNFSFVGQLQFIAKGNDSIYPPSAFFAMAQCFNVARTETYKEMSLEAGFTRFHNRPQYGLTFLNDDWAQWAKDDYEHKGSDDDTVAFCWLGKHKELDMLGLAVTGFIQPNFGRIIENLVFHFGSCNEARGVMSQMPQQYQDLTRRINEDYSDTLIEEMVTLARAKSVPAVQILSRNFWNGKTKESSPPTDELNSKIELLNHHG